LSPQGFSKARHALSLSAALARAHDRASVGVRPRKRGHAPTEARPTNPRHPAPNSSLQETSAKGKIQNRKYLAIHAAFRVLPRSLQKGKRRSAFLFLKGGKKDFTLAHPHSPNLERH